MIYDSIIIGAGPAGLTASIYSSCLCIDHLIIGKEVGGQLLLATEILNYPGFYSIKGKELTDKIVKQTKILGGKILSEEVVELKKASRKEKKQNFFQVKTKSNRQFFSKSVIVATGAERRKLNIVGEEIYYNRGVFYCATCEKKHYKSKNIAVIGGGNSAVQAVVHLQKLAKKVFLVYRGQILRAEQILIENIDKNKVKIIYESNVQEIKGDRKKVKEIVIKSKPTAKPNLSILGGKVVNKNESGVVWTMPVEAVFIEIGGVPGSSLLLTLGVKLDDCGYVKTKDLVKTHIEGVFVAGDLVANPLSLQQVVFACASGAAAAVDTYRYILGTRAPAIWGKAQIRLGR